MKLVFLSQEFYEKYSGCKEILQKSTRPYVCLEVCVNGLTFAIPFRHHIPHKYAFMIEGESGLDYTKAVLILAESDISEEQPWIDQKSFNAIKGQERRIQKGMRDFLKIYKKARQYRVNPRYRYILQCSTLSYFLDQI